MVFLKPYSELLACVLKSSVTMEQWVGVWLKGYSLIKSIHDKRIIVVITDFKSNDPTVIKIQDISFLPTKLFV